MIAKKISFASRSVMPLRNFGGRVPSIKFIGKRSLTNKSVSAFQQEVAAATPVMNDTPVQAPTNKKTVSPNA